MNALRTYLELCGDRACRLGGIATELGRSDIWSDETERIYQDNSDSDTEVLRSLFN